ncbi:MAG: flagellar basal-body rod protein FlgG [Deltaproteobacteria bacterium]|nr:flagellar basal-body rod protein FlgG [Deltaproteobacteria bacterium]
MLRSLFTAATGMLAQQLNLDVIANNLANVNTSGFKKSRADFQDLMYQIMQEPGSSATQQGTSPTGIQVGLGVRPEAVGKIFSQGDFESTGHQLDMAVEGEGFFQITLPNGNTAYTRSGAFKLNEEGAVVNSDGFQLEPAITIPPDALSITIASDGIVTVRQPGATAPTQVGQVQTVRFQNAAGLRASGRNLYEETESSGTASAGTPGEDGFGTIAQGFLESSNVSVVEEIVKMVTGQRAYEANSKVIQTADQILSNAVNIKR